MEATKSKRISEKLIYLTPENRKEVLSEVKECLLNRDLTLKNYRIIWKGFFYALWGADKIKNQNCLSEELAKLIFFISRKKLNMDNWVRACFNIINREWNKIDYLRINKFMKLVRFVVAQIFKFYHDQSWNPKVIENFSKIITEEIFSGELIQLNNGFRLHYLNVFVEELAELKKFTDHKYQLVTEPFVKLVQTTDNSQMRQQIITNIFQKFAEMKFEGKFRKLKFTGMKQKFFDLAKSEDTKEGNRQSLYEIVETFDDLQSALQVQPNRKSSQESDLEEEEESAVLQELIKSEDQKSKKKDKKAKKEQKQENSKIDKEIKNIEEQSVQKKKVKKEQQQKLEKQQKSLITKQIEEELENEQEEQENSDNSEDYEDLEEDNENDDFKEFQQMMDKNKNKKDKKKQEEEVEEEDNEEDYTDDEDEEEGEEELDDDEDEEEELDEDEDEDEEDYEEGDDLSKVNGQLEQLLQGYGGGDDDDEEDEDDFEDIDEDEYEGEEDEEYFHDQYQDETELYKQLMDANVNKLQLAKKFKIPVHLLFNPTQKTKYFKSLNQDYYKSIEKEKNLNKPKHKKKVVFQINNNQTKVFDKLEEVSKINPEGKGPQLHKVGVKKDKKELLQQKNKQQVKEKQEQQQQQKKDQKITQQQQNNNQSKKFNKKQQQKQQLQKQNKKKNQHHKN